MIRKDLKVKKDNIKGLFKNPTTRPVIFIMLGLTVGLLGFGIMSLGKTSDAAATSAAQAARVDNVTHTPGVSSDAEHNRLQAEENARIAALAQQESKSNIPTLTGNTSINDPLVLPTTPPPINAGNQPLPVQQPSYLPDMPPTSIPLPSTTGPSPYQQDQSAQPIQELAPPPKPVASEVMVQQMAAYLNLWGPGSKEYHEYSYAAQREKDASQTAQTGAASQAPSALQEAAAAQGPQAQSAQSQQDNAIRFARAGTMLPAVLITPLNTDTPGPVIAQVTTGALAGARLLGDMQKNGDSVLIKFNSISKPGWPDSYPVQAVGMDLKSSTAVASHVNKHYMQRYSSALAGSFLSGLGGAMQQGGILSTIFDGGVQIESKELTTKEAVKRGKGAVLNKLGGELGAYADRPSTVRVEGPAGQPFPIRILFMENF